MLKYKLDEIKLAAAPVSTKAFVSFSQILIGIRISLGISAVKLGFT
jgi:hypothetical protein